MRHIALLFSVSFALSSCTGFPSGWSEVKQAAPPDAVSGAWMGTWRSDVNGHSGGLWCVAEKRGPGTWQFRYRASWAKILSAGFSLDAAVKPDGRGGYTVSGSRDLGKIFGGVFTSTGTIRDGKFSARYEAKLDRGAMELRRPRGGGLQPPP